MAEHGVVEWPGGSVLSRGEGSCRSGIVELQLSRGVSCAVMG